MAGINNIYNPNPYAMPNYQTYNPIQQVAPQVARMDNVYVTGIQGANAYQMPPGVQQMILWDADMDSFYVKKLDEMGRPKVVAWKDFHDHVVEQEPQVTQQPAPQIDISAILSKIDLSKFLTKDDLDKALSELSVGEKGKVVRNNEFNS